MATSGQFNTTSWKGNYGTRYLEFNWSRSSFDVPSQTTTIRWWITARGTYTGYVSTGPIQVVIDGKTVYNDSSRVKLYPHDPVCDGYATIQHNADGTKNLSISVKAAIYSSSINCSGSGNYDLDLVGMASITEAPDFNDEENPTITYTNPVGNAISMLSTCISFTGETPDVPYRFIEVNGSSYTFQLTDGEREILRAGTQGSNSRKVKFYLRGVIDDKIYFTSKEVVFTVINAQPRVSGTVIDVNPNTTALSGDNTTLIRGYSTAQATRTATVYKNATVSSEATIYEGSYTSDYNKLYFNVNSNIFGFNVVDSRGNIAETTVVAPMIDYIRPTANIDPREQMTPEGSYDLRVSGNYYNDTFGYTDAAQANTIQVAYRYKKQGEEYSPWYAHVVPDLDGNTYSYIANIGGLDYRSTYVFQSRITDKLNTVDSAEMIVRSLPVFHWSGDDFVFEVPVYFNAGFNGEGEIPSGGSSGGNTTTNEPCAIQNGVYSGDLTIDGDTTLTGDLWLKNGTNYGNTIYFGDKSYVYMSEATDDAFTIKATNINLQGNVKVNGNAITSGGSGGGESGTWYPLPNDFSAMASLQTYNGWYQKVGNVVVIGWLLKFTANAGYNDTEFKILASNLPYAPAYPAFGGGVAHNIYLLPGYNFEGWAIDENFNITVRGQPCNLTTAANLNITSTAYYPYGNSQQVITSAGTICYMTNAGDG